MAFDNPKKPALAELQLHMEETGGSLDLSGTQITALPEGLSVGGSLDLCRTPVTALPEGLSVGGSLDLCRTQITALPEGLSVGRSLDLRGTPITALPEGLSVGRSLYLSGTQITALPEGLSVGGSLYLSGTPVPVIYTDTRGYELRRIKLGSHGEWWGAGCRKFESRADATAHWGGVEYPDKKRGADFCAAINSTPESWED
jgi:hypothetical protein